MRRFDDRQHKWYAGIDLHARIMHLGALDAQGTLVCDTNLPCRPDAFLAAIAPFRHDVFVGAECMYPAVLERYRRLSRGVLWLVPPGSPTVNEHRDGNAKPDLHLATPTTHNTSQSPVPSDFAIPDTGPSSTARPACSAE